ncbi:uncharacterized protein BcabD6B2_54470 [Babesia caballi]|uniref:Lon N-terminal domain-containing protein n=1 Tax=Babesia caballi TaxID=5871 RepID=A0AAV4M3Q7_BABCB|nr:hypothetical protein, conserved [Babesia caballi]
MGIPRTVGVAAAAIAGIQGVSSLYLHNRTVANNDLRHAVSGGTAFLAPPNSAGWPDARRSRGVARLSADSDGRRVDEGLEGEEVVPGRIHDDHEDHVTVHEELERKSIDYIDNQLLEQKQEPASGAAGDSSDQATGSKGDSEYFNWNKIRDNGGLESEEVVKSVDSTGSRELEKGQRPMMAGRGTDMELNIEEYPTNVDTGRLNEWCASWQPGEKVMSFFPILIDEYSLVPSPLQLGFEEPVIFRGKYVDMTFNSLIEDVKSASGDAKQVFGMCFINPSSGQLAPLAVYAELLSREAFVDGGGERLKVKARVLGRVILHKVVMEEPFIKARVMPMEDDPRFTHAADVPKLVDEITTLHDACNRVECEMMELLDQPYAVARIKGRPNLHDLIDERLNHFGVDLARGPQAFAQIAAYTAFDYHLTADERYDALAMQDSFDRLRFVRDCLRAKLKQLNILKKAPRDKLADIVEQMRQMKLHREEALEEASREGEEEGKS